MKKLILMMGVVFGALTLTNCTNDIDEGLKPEAQTKDFALTVLAGDNTRTSIDDFTTSWTAGDQINVFYAPAGTTDYVNAGAYTITAENLAANKFTGSVPEDFDTAAAYDWYVIYPYNEALATPANTSVTMTVGQAAQTQNGYNSTAHLSGANAPLVGKVENTNAPAITMNHLASVVQLTVYNDLEDTMVVNGVAIEAEQHIAGNYAVSFADEIVYKAIDEVEESNKVALTVNGATEIPAGGNAVVYVSVKPFVAEANETLKITVNTGAGERVIFKALTKQLDFQAGKVKQIGVKASSAGTKVLSDATFNFLRAIIDGNLMGAQTPVVEDWGNFDVEFPGIIFTEIGGKLEITSINASSFIALPSTIDLPELTYFHAGENAKFNGQTFPTTWNTPKLEYVNIAVCGFVGEFPASFAANTPAMHTIFMNNNNFYGAWPHFWAAGVNGGSGKLECFIAAGGNDGMGYMVPATLDVKLNAWKNGDQSQGHANPSRDLTQIKLGGAEKAGNYKGFEKGWGQERYVTYAGGAADDKTTWHAKRGLTANENVWAWYFSNLPGAIPQVMLDWDQAAADAYTLEVTPEPVAMGEGTKAFLQAIVDGKLMGDQTPVVSNWDFFAATFPGITIAEIGGKLEVTSIKAGSFTALPSTIDLPELTYFHAQENAKFNGQTFPTTWNAPKLEYVNIAVCGFVGEFPASFAANTPAMHTIFMNNNNFSGAWPHFWAAGVNGGTGRLECFIAAGGNEGMGYMVPATLDVKLNAWKNGDQSQGHANPSRDLTQIKLGGADKAGNYNGFEKGWGQERYVTYAGGAADDKDTWHAKRGLTANEDVWAWFFSNLPGAIPQVMLDWDQAAADAYTASKL